jgi:hypothetical protein
MVEEVVSSVTAETTRQGFKLLTAKFAGRCRDCKGSVSVGEEVLWKRHFGVLHADASLCGRTVHDGYGREVSVVGTDHSYGFESATYEDGKRAALTDDDSFEAVESFKVSAEFRRGFGDYASTCPDGCCGQMAPGVVC